MKLLRCLIRDLHYTYSNAFAAGALFFYQMMLKIGRDFRMDL